MPCALARIGPFALLLATLAAQVPTDPAVLRQRLEDKRTSPFLLANAWHGDLGEAQRVAARDGKLILVHCTRSFVPCGTSIRCERDVLASPEFAGLAARVVLYCHVTAHVDAAEDQRLYALRGSGWPHHAVLDATGRILGTHESWRDKSVAELTALVDAAERYRACEAACEADRTAANRRQLEAGLQAGALSLDEGRRLLAAAGPLPRDVAERHAAQLTDLEIAQILARHDRFDPKAQAAAGAEFTALWRAGKRPGARNPARDFWGGILLHQEQLPQPDQALQQTALQQFEALLGDARGYRDFLAARRQALLPKAPAEALTQRRDI